MPFVGLAAAPRPLFCVCVFVFLCFSGGACFFGFIAFFATGLSVLYRPASTLL
jgi:hypothetical protein